MFLRCVVRALEHRVLLCESVSLVTSVSPTCCSVSRDALEEGGSQPCGGVLVGLGPCCTGYRLVLRGRGSFRRSAVHRALSAPPPLASRATGTCNPLPERVPPSRPNCQWVAGASACACSREQSPASSSGSPVKPYLPSDHLSWCARSGNIFSRAESDPLRHLEAAVTQNSPFPVFLGFLTFGS